MAKKDDFFRKKNSDHGSSTSDRAHHGSGRRGESDDASQGRDKPAWLSKSSSSGSSYSKWSEKYDNAIARDSKGSGTTDDQDEDAGNDLINSSRASIPPDEEFEKLSAKIDDAIASTLKNTTLFREKESSSDEITRPATFNAETPTISGQVPAGVANEDTEAQGASAGQVPGGKKEIALQGKLPPLDENAGLPSDSGTTKPAMSPIDLTDASIAKKMKADASTAVGKKAGAPSAPSEDDIAVKATSEELNQLEQEMTIDTNVDRCIVCKKELAGDVFICPNCKNAKYHKSCIEALVANGEPCWVCQKHIISEQAEKEVKSLQLRLNYIAKSIDDLSAQFKSGGGEISDETFTETYNQFKQDKDAIEKQISAKLKKEPQPSDDEENQ